jgi:hypothetical protein
LSNQVVKVADFARLHPCAVVASTSSLELVIGCTVVRAIASLLHRCRSRFKAATLAHCDELCRPLQAYNTRKVGFSRYG